MYANNAMLVVITVLNVIMKNFKLSLLVNALLDTIILNKIVKVKK